MLSHSVEAPQYVSFRLISIKSPGNHLVRVNGPVPNATFPVLKSSVVASTKAESIIEMRDISFGVNG